MLSGKVVEGIALTFDDVLILPRRSNVIPRDVDIRTKLTKNISLNIPILSAAMDTVTEARLAIALAQAGGIGIIHKNMSIDEQVTQVRKVKKFESWIIRNPVTVSPEDKIEKLFNIINAHGIGSFPVIDENRKVIGIVTMRDIRFDKNPDEKVKNVMTKHPVTITEKDVNKAMEIMDKHKIEKLPVVDEQGRLKGLVTWTDLEKTKKYPNALKDKEGRLLVGAAVGPFDEKRVESLINAEVDVIVIDTAHGHSENVINAIKRIKKRYAIDIIGGNVATKEGSEDLIAAGADVVKVGVGPGSICTTRIIAGVGVPQITAIMSAVESAEKHGVRVIADGGIKYSGDMAKSIAAGASAVMIGSLFAGTEEAPGDVVFIGGRKYKRYRGMGSISAMKKGSKDRYSQAGETKLVPEGVEGVVPYRGNVSEIVFQLVGGLKSSMGYSGCKNIDEMRKNAKLVRITPAGLKESHPHDIIITEESPNYWKV
ncbi:MAG: IMP dehydrogenase [Candidatus Aenigmarchaeota archaeon]|nr:IMP dehydrogenase [Candidatus Aenigmarchaeota archaeon]